MDDLIVEERKKNFKCCNPRSFLATPFPLIYTREKYATNVRKQKREAALRELRSVKLQTDDWQQNCSGQDTFSKANSELFAALATDVKPL